MSKIKRNEIKNKPMKIPGVNLRSRAGMELVQVALLIALAVTLGLIFKTEITDFVNKTFERLNGFN